ncbi:MAG: D-2-hydroxyacid dehydrogenase [Anaerovoracaceae bacterium]|jgi:phosphoglycerate dehydrogenase-like enzyme
MEKKKVLIAMPLHKDRKERFIEEFPECEFEFIYRKDLKPEDLRGKEVIMGFPKPEWLGEADKMKWLQIYMAGNDAYTKAYAEDPAPFEGWTLTNASGCYSLAISEYMVGMSLAYRLNLFAYDRDMRKKQWTDNGSVYSAEGAVVLSVGTGSIGGAYCKRMKALGSYVIGVRRSHHKEVPDFCDEMHTVDELDELLPRADIVALSMPATGESSGMLNMRRFKLMKDSAIVINVGRGGAIVQSDLVEALNNDIIGGACLDVFEKEPIPEDDPIWDAKNAVLTPHVSGGWHLYQTIEYISDLSMRNLRHYLNGEPLENVVDLKKGY